MSPNSSNTGEVRFVRVSGHVHNTGAEDWNVARPVVYLKANISCKNCGSSAGTKANPFQIA